MTAKKKAEPKQEPKVEDSKPVEATSPDPEKAAQPIDASPEDVTTFEEDDDPESLVGEEVKD